MRIKLSTRELYSAISSGCIYTAAELINIVNGGITV